MSKRVQPALVGTFVVVGVASIIGLALLFGSGALSRDTMTLVSFFDGDVSGLQAGAPVTFRGVNIGAVQEVLISLPDDPRASTTDSRVVVTYDLDLEKVRAVSPGQTRDLRDPVQFEELIQAGLRVGIKTNNMLAGIKSLTMDIRPDVPDNRLAGMELPYPEVPTIPNPFTQLQARLEGLADKVADLPVDSIINNVNGLVTDLRLVIGSENFPELMVQVTETLDAFSEAATGLNELMAGVEESRGDITEGLDRTMVDARALLESMDATLAQIRSQTGPGSAFSYRMLSLLEQMELTARSMRELVEYLEANPSSLLRGRGGGEE